MKTIAILLGLPLAAMVLVVLLLSLALSSPALLGGYIVWMYHKGKMDRRKLEMKFKLHKEKCALPKLD